MYVLYIYVFEMSFSLKCNPRLWNHTHLRNNSYPLLLQIVTEACWQIRLTLCKVFKLAEQLRYAAMYHEGKLWPLAPLLILLLITYFLILLVFEWM